MNNKTISDFESYDNMMSGERCVFVTSLPVTTPLCLIDAVIDSHKQTKITQDNR
jgi:hypothetical protein